MARSTFEKQYDVTTETITINGRRFKLYVPRSLDRFIDAQDGLRNFPLWAKVWQASWVLADHLARTPAGAAQSMLEIGAGLGLVGIVAASFGHRVTLTEHDPDALEFAKANAVLNRCPEIVIHPLDWHKPAMGTMFDTIVGSEVVYHLKDIAALRKVFRQCLKPQGRIILAMEFRQTLPAFFDQMAEEFKIRIIRKKLGGEDQAVAIIISELTRRNGS